MGGEPCRLVGAGAARQHADCGAPVGARHDGPLGPDDDVVDDIAADQGGGVRGGCRAQQSGGWHAGPRRASSTAIRAAKAALFLISAMLALRLCPPLSSLMRASRNGVSCLPDTPATSASRQACSICASTA